VRRIKNPLYGYSVIHREYPDLERAVAVGLDPRLRSFAERLQDVGQDPRYNIKSFSFFSKKESSLLPARRQAARR
jgi:hypothetical protein